MGLGFNKGVGFKGFWVLSFGSMWGFLGVTGLELRVGGQGFRACAPGYLQIFNAQPAILLEGRGPKILEARYTIKLKPRNPKPQPQDD